MPAQHFTDDNFDLEVLKSDQPVLVDFFATWCGPCQQIAPIIEALATEYQNKVKIGKLDVDQDGAIAQRYGIMSIPSLIIFKGGQPVQIMVGFQSKEKLKEEIDKVI
ncbi:MAG: thioredoxin, thioredoxin 1 [Candidatus Peregrinibacteria bacterium GW2011_GWE2_39_6]|nr:MAG: thioredoxin, thioredoxin 1 [Candidatus Peregrinibacteria bacterium GW2011_GWF2_39_17]KKR25507.1 MAG: thioredoxin, thioredoxin 1 [Candidatus Peregrinibacteria bacterium GW2011_GWE2_39_6]HCW31931.1 thioredoxin [Candidatus Peregrinibacteria bacterium]